MAHNPLLGDKWKGLVEKNNGVLNWTGKIKLFPETLTDKKLRGKNKVIFINSKCDLFHEKVTWGVIEKVMATIEECPQHTLLILTKRPHLMAEYFNSLGKRYELSCCPNLWLGVTVENQETADERIPILLQIPAAVRFVSIEPMLEPIIFTKGLWSIPPHAIGKLDWGVVGCESGPKRRSCPDVRGIVGQFQAASIPIFVKQLSINGKVEHDISKFPKDLQIRQCPERMSNGHKKSD